MERLFRINTVKKLGLLGKRELLDYIEHCRVNISHLRRQIIELQRENERLKLELGYGKTASFTFELTEVLNPNKRPKRKRSRASHTRIAR